MVFDNTNWNNKRNFKIDNSKIEQDLINFPIALRISSETGIDNYDISNIFTKLASNTTVDQYTKLMLQITGDFSNHKVPVIGTVGTPQIIPNITPSGVFPGSMYFDGSGDYLILDYNDTFSFEAEDFTLEAYVYHTANSNLRTIMSRWRTGDGTASWYMGRSTTGKLRVLLSSDGTSSSYDYSTTASIGLDEWHHVAITRSGTTMYGAIDGTVENIGSLSGGFTLDSNSRDVYIGRMSEASAYEFAGYMSGLRITKGESLYTSNFTPPTWPYTVYSGTGLILGFEGDTSASGHNMTFLGGTSMRSSVGHFDGGLHFGGSDYVTIPDNPDWFFGSDDFTIDLWIEFLTAPGTTLWESFISQWYSSGNGDESFHCGIKSADGNVVGFSYSTTGSDSVSILTDYVPSVGVPFHYAVVRSGQHLNIYINGVSRGYNAIGTASLHNSSRNVEIGGFQGGTFTNFNGYLSEIRISKGIARWKTNFVPPKYAYKSGSSWYNRKKLAVTTTVTGVETELYTEIEDWFDGYVTKYPKENNTSTVKATSYYSSNYYPWFGTDPSLNLTGSISNNAWLAGNGNHTNQKYSVDLGEAVKIKRILLHNICDSGSSYYNVGINNFLVYGTNSNIAFNDTTYTGTTGLTLIQGFNARQHAARDVEDKEYFYLNNDNLYRYYVLRIADDFGGASPAMGLRHIEFQEYHKEATLWTKLPIVYSGTENWLSLYYDKTQEDNDYLNPDITCLIQDSYVDYSNFRHTITKTGNLVLVDSKAENNPVLNNSAYFDGTSAHLILSDHADWNFGSGDFTVDWWEYRVTSSVGESSCASDTSGVYKGILAGDDAGTGTLNVYMSSDGATWDIADAKSIGTKTLNQWVHMAVVRSGNNFYAFKDGIIQSTWSSSSALYYNNTGFFIGKYHTTYVFNGYMAGFRISKGIARWVSAFTPPRSYTSDTNTKLLINFTESGWGQGATPATFTDSGATGHTVTNDSSNVSGCTFWWHRTLDFDGAGDYISMPTSTVFDFGSNDFTIDMWVFPQQLAKHQRLICRHNASTGWLLTINNTNTITYGNGAVSLTSTSTIVINKWLHVAVVRNGNDWRLYINGISEANTTNSSSSVDNAIAVQIGRLATQTTYDLNGQLAEIRVLKDTALWTSNFKPPTFPTSIGYIGDLDSPQAHRVWNYDFKAVYHMNQDPSGGTDSILESTFNNTYDATPYGSMTIADLIHSSGTIGKGLNFDGTDDYVQESTLYFPTNVTLYSTIDFHTTGSVQIIMHQGDTTVGGQQGTMFYISATGYPSIQYYSGGWRLVTSTIALTDGIHNIFISINSSDLTCIFNVDGVNNEVSMPAVLVASTYPFKIGAAKQSIMQDFFGGTIDEVRIVKVPHNGPWLKATHYSNFDQLLYVIDVQFYFSNPIPPDLSTAYGYSKQLSIIVTLSGTESSYIYDAEFYDAGDVQIGSTVSGVNSSQAASVNMSTTSGTTYYWYVKATSSGISDTSSTYQFINKFLCEGYVEDQGARVSGIPVRLHRRSNGEVIGNDVSSTVSGTFAIPTDYNEDHYVVALHTDPTYNALIYDRITP